MFRLIFSSLLLISSALFASTLEERIDRDFKLLNYPTAKWRVFDEEICDVAIIGAGMSGCALACHLQLEGVDNVQLFDQASNGKEGPWLTTARMNTLRSGKALRGPCIGIPHLTFRAFYESKYGSKRWDELGKIPTKLWGKYLQWVKTTMNLKVNSRSILKKIEPNSDHTLRLVFEDGKVLQAKKVVLATGRAGFGGREIPDFVEGLPKAVWAHTADMIDMQQIAKKRVCVIGVGASGFDAAAAALEKGASSVKMIMRRSELPKTNYFSSFSYPGFQYGFFFLSDDERVEFFTKAFELGIPAPEESIKRLEPYSHFELLASTKILGASMHNREIHLETSKGVIKADFLILATGYAVDVSKTDEIAAFADKIKLWQDQQPHLSGKIGRFPYLGRHFEFLEKVPGTSPALANIHCFNYGAFLSHGRISGDIDCIDIGLRRLSEGICIGLFLQDTCRNGEPTPSNCPGTCQSGLCSPFLNIPGLN